MIIERTRYDEEYIPQEETIKFFVWMNTYFDEENRSAESHFQLIDHVNTKHQFKGIECSRGLAKSTLIGIYKLLYWAYLGRKPGFGTVDYALYIMDTVSQVGANFEQLLMILDENEALKKHLKVKKSRLGDDPTIYIYNVDLKKTIYLKGRGTGQKMRGTRIGGKRPNIILLDDIENDENVESKESREKLANWFYNAVIPAVNPNRFEIIFIGTPLHQDALLVKLLENPKFVFIQLPAAEELTLEMLKDKNVNVISAWSDRFTKKYLLDMYDLYKGAGRTTAFWQEFMLQIAPKEDLLFEVDKIRRYNIEDLKGQLSDFTYYVSVDPAISQSTSADYTAISVIGVNSNNDWFLVDGFFGRIKPDELIDKVFEYAVMYRPYSVVIEKVAFQTSLKTFMEKEMLLRKIYFSVDLVSRPTHKNSKLSVIKALQPIVSLGKFWIPDTYMKNFTDELILEMSMVTNEKILAKHDDLIDSIAQLTLISILTQVPVAKNSEINRLDSKNSYLF